MATYNQEPPVWRHFEETFIIRWLYKQGHSWKMTMVEVVVAEIIKRLQAKLRQRYPGRHRSAIEILSKIAALKEDFLDYVDFMSTPGVRFEGSRPVIYSWDAYLKHVGPREPPRFRRCRMYGMNEWRKQQFMFDGGYMGVVDLDFVAYYLEDEW